MIPADGAADAATDDAAAVTRAATDDADVSAWRRWVAEDAP